MNDIDKFRLQYSDDYKFLKGIYTAMDKYYLDPILGAIVPGLGDIITAICTIPFVFTSIFKIRSIPLTLSIIYNALVDIAIGLFPVIGDIIDAFYKPYKASYLDIIGFVEGDETVINEINNKALKTCILITALCIIVRLLAGLIISLITWFRGLF